MELLLILRCCVLDNTELRVILQIDGMYQVSDFLDDSSLDTSGGGDEVGVDDIVQRRIEEPDDYVTHIMYTRGQLQHRRAGTS